MQIGKNGKKEKILYALFSVGMLTATTFFSRLLFHTVLNESVIIMLYLLTVFLISRFTAGYWYGAISSLLSVFLFNFFFTEPYFSLLAYDAKYPMIFLIMLIVSIVTSATTVRIRQEAEEKILLSKEHEMNLRLIENEKLRGTILRSISHDLRTPLTSISGAVSVILDKDDSLTAEENVKFRPRPSYSAHHSTQ